MLKVIDAGGSLPKQFLVDPSAIFDPGQIAQLKIVNTDSVATVSDGLRTIGIIDDIKNSVDNSTAVNTAPIKRMRIITQVVIMNYHYLQRTGCDFIQISLKNSFGR